jgi:hypothetical protein
MLKDTADFAESVELMMKKTLGIPLEEQVILNTSVICKSYTVKFRYSNLEFLIVMEFQYSKRHQKSL